MFDDRIVKLIGLCGSLGQAKHPVSERIDAIWAELFEQEYTKPGEEQKKGGWKARTEWVIKLNPIRNENFHTYSVKEEEYEFLQELFEWLVEGRVENDLD